MTDKSIETFVLEDDGVFPNNHDLPLILYREIFSQEKPIDPEKIEETFASNHWIPAWRNGIFPFHHYHSRAHEALGIFSGWVKVKFGGRSGEVVQAVAGDVIVIPAGVSHKNLGQSEDFAVIGAYPVGQTWDMQYGKPEERPQADINIQNVSVPSKDPITGESGILIQKWKNN